MGWCFENIHPDSRITDEEKHFMVLCNNAFSFEVLTINELHDTEEESNLNTTGRSMVEV